MTGMAAGAIEVPTEDPKAQWWTSWWVAVVMGVLAAFPTVAYWLRGGGLVTDDWKILGEIAYGGLGQKIMTRPIGYSWYGIEYWAFGQAVWPHLLLLAVANAVVAVLLYRLLLRYVPHELALIALAVWVVLPNRSSTRFWAAATPIVVSLALVLLVTLLRAAPRAWLSHPRVLVSALLTAAVLTYEGVLGIVVGLVIWEAWRETGMADRVRTAVAVGAVPALATVWVFANAPLREGFTAFTTTDRLVSVVLGDALLPEGATKLGPLLLLPVAWAGATLVLPSFRTRIEERLIVAAAIVVVLGLVPFVMAGFPFSTTGLNDRGAYVMSVGLTFVLAGTIGLAARATRPLAVVCLFAVLVLLAPQAWEDMDDYLAAIEDGERLQAALEALPDEIDLTGAYVLESLPNNGGVQFLNTTGELRRYVAVTDDSLSFADLEDLWLVDSHHPRDSYTAVTIALEDDRLVVVDLDE